MFSEDQMICECQQQTSADLPVIEKALRLLRRGEWERGVPVTLEAVVTVTRMLSADYAAQ